MHLPSDSDLHEPSLISPPTRLKCLLFLIKLPQIAPRNQDHAFRTESGDGRSRSGALETRTRPGEEFGGDEKRPFSPCSVGLLSSPSSPAVPQQQHGPNALQMSEPSSFNISLTLHQSYQVSPRFRLDKISQDCGKGEKKKRKGRRLQLQLCCSANPASSRGSRSLARSLALRPSQAATAATPRHSCRVGALLPLPLCSH